MYRHVYVHVPFCSRRCAYCDFAIAVRRVVPVEDYVAALEGELRIRLGESAADAAISVDTLYLGGGTPSRLGGVGVAESLRVLRRWIAPVEGAEITIEANPEDVSAEAVAAWREAGVTRVSLGGQSFDPAVLAWMHRAHDGDATAAAVRTLREGGIPDISLDLIFSLPAALRRNLRTDVERVLALQPQHVSLYGLTVEQGTPLGRWVDRGVTIPGDDAGYERDFLDAHEWLREAGFQHYEVSNFARPGHRARHNSAYWAGVPYLGLGPSAHGFDGRERRWNERHYAAWRARVAAHDDPREGAELITPDNRMAEAVYLGLRTVDGLQTEPGDHALLETWRKAGWVESSEDGRVRCTPMGWLRLDALAAALTHHRSR